MTLQRKLYFIRQVLNILGFLMCISSIFSVVFNLLFHWWYFSAEKTLGYF